ncbi:ankyrin repeat-containing domain protein, partial [Podospora didyma]
ENETSQPNRHVSRSTDILVASFFEGHSTLTAAFKCNFATVVQYLPIEQQADVHFRSATGSSALYEAMAMLRDLKGDTARTWNLKDKHVRVAVEKRIWTVASLLFTAGPGISNAKLLMDSAEILANASPGHLAEFFDASVPNADITSIHQMDTALLQFLIRASLDINVIAANNESPLTVAIRARRKPLILQLRGLGANPLLRGSRFRCGQDSFANARVTAAGCGDLELLRDFVESEPELGIDSYGTVPGSERLLDIPCGMEIEDLEFRCANALTTAIYFMHGTLVLQLLEMGASPAKSAGFSPLAAALYTGRLETARILIERRDRSVSDTLEHVSPLEVVAAHFNYEAIELLVSWKPTISSLYFILQDQPKLTQILLEAGADPNTGMWDPSGKKRCVLTFTISQPYPDSRRAEQIKLLLAAGAPPDRPDDFDQVTPSTSPQLAIRKMDYDTVKLLLEHKANPNAVRPDDRHTPLQIAACNGDFRTASLLTDSGADVSVPSDPSGGKSALQFAAMRGFVGIAEMLIQRGASTRLLLRGMGEQHLRQRQSMVGLI